MSDHSRVRVLDHPLVRHHLSGLRNRHTTADVFRQHVRVLSALLGAEATRNLPEQSVRVETPLETITCRMLGGRVAVVPILRAGLGMVAPLTDLIPQAEVWHLGMFRDEETATPVAYYDKLPDDDPPEVALVLDPMLATGGSAVAALQSLQRWKVGRVAMLSIIAAPEGIDHLTRQFPDVEIFTCAIDRGLNDRKFIVPGLGDAGDRIFNT